MQIEQSETRILADCIEGMAADAEDKGKDSFGIHLSLKDARMIARSLGILPTVDAVPVVRCRECRYFYTDEYGFPACAESGAMLNPEEDDYCSRGQRRDQSADVRNMVQFAGDGKTDGGGGDES